MCDRRAQGLIETIVAIGVIMTGLFSVLTLVISNLNGQREAAARYQAVNLAREGLDIVRNLRDTNWLEGANAWDGIFAQESAQEYFLTVDPEASQASVNIDGDARVYRDSATGIFEQGTDVYTTGTATPFTRTLTIRVIGCGAQTVLCDDIPEVSYRDEIALEVISKVEWKLAGKNHSLELKEVLYDWR